MKLASYAITEFGLSERQACRTVQVSRCAYRYQAKKTADEPIVQELRQLADRQPRWGCGKMTRLSEKPGTWLEPQADPQSVPSDGTAFEEKTEKALACSHCPDPGSAGTSETRPGHWIS